MGSFRPIHFNRRKNKKGFCAISVLSLATAASCWTGVASGATINVSNPGFDVFQGAQLMGDVRFINGADGLTENETVYSAATGQPNNELAAFFPTGWVANNPLGFQFIGVTRYDSTFLSEDPAGPTMGFITTRMSQDATPSPILGTFTQDLGVLAQPDTIYTVTVNVHDQIGAAFPTVVEVDLLAGTTVLDDVDSFTAPTTDGARSVYTATVTTGATAPTGNLSVRLLSGGGGTNGATFASAIFDNVSITSQPVPEPAALSLLGLAALAAGRRRRN